MRHDELGGSVSSPLSNLQDLYYSDFPPGSRTKPNLQALNRLLQITKKLRKLYIFGIELDPVEVPQFRDALHSHPTLEEIVFQTCRGASSDIGRVVSALATISNLQKVRCGILNSASSSWFCNHLAILFALPNLTFFSAMEPYTLPLTYHSSNLAATPAGMEAIFSAIANSVSLKRLCLPVQLESRLCILMGDAIRQNSSLISLHLEFFVPHDDEDEFDNDEDVFDNDEDVNEKDAVLALAAITTAIAASPNMKTLRLHFYTTFFELEKERDDHMFRSLVAMVQTNRSITQLGCGALNYTPQYLQQIQPLLDSNKRLRNGDNAKALSATTTSIIDTTIITKES